MAKDVAEKRPPIRLGHAFDAVTPAEPKVDLVHRQAGERGDRHHGGECELAAMRKKRRRDERGIALDNYPGDKHQVAIAKDQLREQRA